MTVFGKVFEVWAATLEEARSFAYNIISDEEDEIDTIEPLIT